MKIAGNIIYSRATQLEDRCPNAELSSVESGPYLSHYLHSFSTKSNPLSMICKNEVQRVTVFKLSHLMTNEILHRCLRLAER